MNASGGDWFESEAFWERFYPFMFAEPQFVWRRRMCPRSSLSGGSAAAARSDLACGPGRYVVPFTQAGFRVTGVDRTRCLLDSRTGDAGRRGSRVGRCGHARVRPAGGLRSGDQRLYLVWLLLRSGRESPGAGEHLSASSRGQRSRLRLSARKSSRASFQPTQAEMLADGTAMIQRRAVIDDWSRNPSRVDFAQRGAGG